MTAHDSRPIQDVIGIALHDVGCHDVCDISIIRSAYRRQIAAVLAACQQATVAQQAQLTGGTIEDDGFTSTGPTFARLVGPWREDPA